MYDYTIYCIISILFYFDFFLSLIKLLAIDIIINYQLIFKLIKI